VVGAPRFSCTSMAELSCTSVAEGERARGWQKASAHVGGRRRACTWVAEGERARGWQKASVHVGGRRLVSCRVTGIRGSARRKDRGRRGCEDALGRAHPARAASLSRTCARHPCRARFARVLAPRLPRSFRLPGCRTLGCAASVSSACRRASECTCSAKAPCHSAGTLPCARTCRLRRYAGRTDLPLATTCDCTDTCRAHRRAARDDMRLRRHMPCAPCGQCVRRAVCAGARRHAACRRAWVRRARAAGSCSLNAHALRAQRHRRRAAPRQVEGSGEARGEDSREPSTTGTSRAGSREREARAGCARPSASSPRASPDPSAGLIPELPSHGTDRRHTARITVTQHGFPSHGTHRRHTARTHEPTSARRTPRPPGLARASLPARVRDDSSGCSTP